MAMGQNGFHDSDSRASGAMNHTQILRIFSSFIPTIFRLTAVQFKRVSKATEKLISPAREREPRSQCSSIGYGQAGYQCTTFRTGQRNKKSQKLHGRVLSLKVPKVRSANLFNRCASVASTTAFLECTVKHKVMGWRPNGICKMMVSDIKRRSLILREATLTSAEQLDRCMKNTFCSLHVQNELFEARNVALSNRSSWSSSRVFDRLSTRILIYLRVSELEQKRTRRILSSPAFAFEMHQASVHFCLKKHECKCTEEALRDLHLTTLN